MCAAICVCSHSCSNKVRFRRDDVHKLFFDLLKKQQLNDESIEYVQDELRKRITAFNKNRRDVTPESAKVETERFDKQIAQLKRMAAAGELAPVFAQACVETAERERAAAIEAATGKADGTAQQVMELAEALPGRVAQFKATVESALKVFADPKRVHEARETTRELIRDGRIV
jgi:hypothetical protein